MCAIDCTTTATAAEKMSAQNNSSTTAEVSSCISMLILNELASTNTEKLPPLYPASIIQRETKDCMVIEPLEMPIIPIEDVSDRTPFIKNSLPPSCHLMVNRRRDTTQDKVSTFHEK